jgi:hypothetical protein
MVAGTEVFLPAAVLLSPERCMINVVKEWSIFNILYGKHTIILSVESQEYTWISADLHRNQMIENIEVCMVNQYI